VRQHAIRIAILWVILTVIAEVLIGVIPIPSPAGSQEGLGAHQTVYMLFYLAAPFFTFIWAMLIYCGITFRRRAGDNDEGPPIADSTPMLLIWAAISFTVVIFLAGWGTFTLKEITSPDGPVKYHITAIGQQWYWTYRYPQFGGAQSPALVLPVKQSVEFDITSLDVVHSLWIRDLDIKEDAVPGVVNHAYVEAKYVRSSNANGAYWAVCNELCGLYHGYMRSRVKVVPLATYLSWGKALQAKETANGLLKNLNQNGFGTNPPYYPPPVYPGAPQNQPT
jgi:cytochrome c oxidase subunit II